MKGKGGWLGFVGRLTKGLPYAKHGGCVSAQYDAGKMQLPCTARESEPFE